VNNFFLSTTFTTAIRDDWLRARQVVAKRRKIGANAARQQRFRLERPDSC